MIRGLVVALGLTVGPAAAQVVGDCDSWVANARNVDWQVPSVTFANGAIRLVQLDTDEPAAASRHILVTFPDPEVGYLDCRLISAGDGLGFAELSVGAARAKYDPARGLTVKVPARIHEGGGAAVMFTINQATGTVVLQ